jgi:hypothetical protein
MCRKELETDNAKNSLFPEILKPILNYKNFFVNIRSDDFMFLYISVMKQKNYIGLGIAIGCGMGIAFGAAFGAIMKNVGFGVSIGIAIGVAIGIVIGTFMNQKMKK